MQSKVFQKIAHPWLLGVSLLMVGIFMGAGIQMMKAQTTAFTEPTCDPGEACNPDGTPIVSSSGSTQTITSPLTVTGAVGINGDITLGAGNKLIRTSSTGQALNVVSSDNYAIVGSTSSYSASSAHAGVFGSGTAGTANGVYGQTLNGSAIYGSVLSPGTGFAGYFEGNVKIGRAANGVAEPAIAGSLTIPNGSLTVSNTTTSKDVTVLNSLEVNGSLIVNGQNVVSGSMQQVALFVSLPSAPAGAPNCNPGTNCKDFTAVNITGSATSYRFIAAQVFVSNTAASPRTWASGGAISYTECSGGSFLGTLRITNNTINNPGAFRIIVTYQKTPVSCANADVTPPAVTITSPVMDANVSGASFPINASASDASAIASYDYYVNGTKVVTHTVSTITDSYSASLVNLPFSPPKITVYVTATDQWGNVGTSLPVQVNFVNNLCNPICGGATPICYFRGCQGNQNDYICISNPQSVPGCVSNPDQ